MPNTRRSCKLQLRCQGLWDLPAQCGPGLPVFLSRAGDPRGAAAPPGSGSPAERTCKTTCRKPGAPSASGAVRSRRCTLPAADSLQLHHTRACAFAGGRQQKGWISVTEDWHPVRTQYCAHVLTAIVQPAEIRLREHCNGCSVRDDLLRVQGAEPSSSPGCHSSGLHICSGEHTALIPTIVLVACQLAVCQQSRE